MSGFRPRFFVPPEMLSPSVPNGVELTLTPEDSHHALRVLRLAENDECEVVVGAAVYAATVSRASDPVQVRLVSRLEGASAGASYEVQVGLVQALIRPSLVDHVIEKGTEVGASFFVLVPAAGSPGGGVVRGDRLARWRRIAQEAAKQSKQVEVPPVDALDSLGRALSTADDTDTLSIVLEPGAAAGLGDTLAGRDRRPARVVLWAGPEGGWHTAEMECFSAAGIEAVHLGRGVLRAETAGPVAVAAARLLLGDW